MICNDMHFEITYISTSNHEWMNLSVCVGGGRQVLTHAHLHTHAIVIENCHFEIFSSTGICTGCLQAQVVSHLFSAPHL